MIFSPEIKNLMKAFVSTQKAIKGIVKDGKGYNYTYITLDIILSLVKPVLADNGLAICQEATTTEEDGVVIPVVKTYLFHESGEYIQTEIMKMKPTPAKGDKVTPQDVGSAITYAKRYQIVALLGLAADTDDDAAAASGNKGKALELSNKKFGNKIDDTHLASLTALMAEKGVNVDNIKKLMASLGIPAKSSKDLTIEEYKAISQSLIKLPPKQPVAVK